MFVRKTLAGAVTVAVTGSVLALTTGAAHAVYTADPDDTTATPVTADVIGVGSDTSQNALFRLAASYNGTVAAGAPRLTTFAATGGGTIPLPTAEINRPNGSGAGKTTLYNPSNPDVDFARSSSTLSTAEINAGLQQFPFALDTLKLVVSGSVASKAPAAISAADMVKIYNGTYDDWSDLGGTAGAIEPKIPQAGSGTRSFFLAQLKAANGNVDVTLASSVQEIQENDPAPIQNNAAAVAPYSAGRAGLSGSALRVEGGFQADRALYNVVRGTDLGDATIQALFGQSGFVCSDAAIDEIQAAGFQQLDSVADGGVCGQSTQAATSNFKINEPVVPIATTTTVSGVSPSPKALRLTARVAGTPTPTGSVQFVDNATEAVLGTASLIGGTATLNLTNRAPGSYVVKAVYTPTVDTAFVASEATGTAKVKAGSAITESFPAALKKSARSAKGVVTVAFSGLATKPTGKVTIKEGAKTVGTGTLKAGKVTITLLKSKVGKGKSTLKITYPGDGNGFGSSKTFSITFKK
ncbi:substrate-binding domain-containing protein [Nocardioides rubriscoriae]|uniref:substrate-binding domain-containing protein n=1 Tax=Nocardioides rubriscoriae TaxID=642762 RepID=UPI0014797C35|nr:Ig-like domain repeat protein [Nocardioides rubriscoriae]